MSTQTQKLAYSPEEVANQLGLHLNTVWQMLRAGKIHAVRSGRRWIVPTKSLEAFLNGETPAGAGRGA